MKDEYNISLNKACRICSLSQSAYYYRPKKKTDDEEIKTVLKLLAAKYKRWGFDKMMGYIKRKQYVWNHKRVHRIYCEMKLNIRIKPKKRLPSRESKVLIQPIKKNFCWSMDFMSDALRCGRKFRTLNVIDDYNREVLLIEPAFSLSAFRITRLLDQMAEVRGYPEMIRVDNGPEFISKIFKSWALRHGILIHYIQPGKPAQNAFIERFNRTYREDILDAYWFDNLIEVKQVSKDWEYDYNHERTHESLGNQSPIDFARAREGLPYLTHNEAVIKQPQNLNFSTFDLS